VYLPSTPGGHQRIVYPAGAVEYLSEIWFAGKLMTPFGVGACVSWNLCPETKVGMDSHYEMAYAPDFAEESMRIYRGEGGWAEFLARRPIDAVLVPAGNPLDSLMSASVGELVPPQEAVRIQVLRDGAYAIFATPETAERMPTADRRGRPSTGRFP
jgi:hypothetical protein